MDRSARAEQPSFVPQGTPDQAIGATTDVERRFRRVVHELSGIVDGARRSAEIAGAHIESDPARARAALATATHGLYAIADILRAASSPEPDAPFANAFTTGLAESLFDASELVRPAAESRGAVLRVVIDDSVRSAPPLPLFPVALNAMRNAVHATRRGSGALIELKAWVEHDRLRLEVIDEGEGVDENLARRRLPFREGVTTNPKGMGIGLAICEEIVDSLGGEVSLSNRLDRVSGCVFAISVPLERESDETP